MEEGKEFNGESLEMKQRVQWSVIINFTGLVEARSLNPVSAENFDEALALADKIKAHNDKLIESNSAAIHFNFKED